MLNATRRMLAGPLGCGEETSSALNRQPPRVFARRRLELVFGCGSTSDKPSESTTERRRRSGSLSKLPERKSAGANREASGSRIRWQIGDVVAEYTEVKLCCVRRFFCVPIRAASSERRCSAARGSEGKARAMF